VERWFAELTTKWLKRGSHRSVAELEQAIQAWIEAWNQQPRPFVWTRPPMSSSTPSPTTANESTTQLLGLGDAAYAGKSGGSPADVWCSWRR